MTNEMSKQHKMVFKRRLNVLNTFKHHLKHLRIDFNDPGGHFITLHLNSNIFNHQQSKLLKTLSQ